MDDLVNAIKDKAGISEDQAKQAADVAVNFIKDKLPDNLADKLDGIISGDGGGAADMMGKLGGLMGK